MSGALRIEFKYFLLTENRLKIMTRSFSRSLCGTKACCGKTSDSFAHAGGVLIVRLALATFLAFVLAGSISGQTPMKVYISVDMEGISGISGNDQLSPGGSEYGRSRKLMAEDANAAIRGAL